MFEIQKDIRFEAAHKLPNHQGKCGRLHGHSFIATLTLRDSEANVVFGSQNGMVEDFATVKKTAVDLVENHLDHQYLNETVHENPTAENIARFIYHSLKDSLPKLWSVTVQETCTGRATFYGDVAEQER